MVAYDDELLLFGNHFRYGATLAVNDPDNVTVYSTRRVPGNAHFNILGSMGSSTVSDLFGGNTLPVAGYGSMTAYLLKNKSGTVAKLDVSYTLDGNSQKQSTGSTALAKTGLVEIPSKAKNIKAEVYAHTGAYWKKFQTYTYGEAMGDARGYTIRGTIFKPDIKEDVVLGQETQYQLKIKTSKETAAGTDADVFLRLVGEQGTTDEVRLNYGVTGQFGVNINPFESNGLDVGVFDFSQDVGEITAVQVRTDQSGPGPDWKVRSIEVIPKYNTTTTKSVTVTPEQWIADKSWHTFYVNASDSIQ